MTGLPAPIDRSRRRWLLASAAGGALALLGLGTAQHARVATWTSKRWVERVIREHLQGVEIDAASLEHFVVDTSRNGQGPWTPPAGYPDPQDWCNPPDRGLGVAPTALTGNALIDAFLWVKIPGESDGECTRGLGPVGTVDPEWGLVDPAAGDWFPEMALDLTQNAAP